MTRKKMIQILAIALLIFSGISIKAETTNVERVVRGLNYGAVGGGVYMGVGSFAPDFIQKNLHFSAENSKRLTRLFACLAHFGVQTATSELIYYFFPESDRTGKRRFVGNVAAAATQAACFSLVIDENNESIKSALVGSAIFGALAGTAMDYFFEKGAEQKNNPIMQLEKMTEQNKCKREEREKLAEQRRKRGEREKQRMQQQRAKQREREFEERRKEKMQQRQAKEKTWSEKKWEKYKPSLRGAWGFEE